MSNDNDSPAVQAKAKGSDAWSKGDYQGSITHFTSAIELSSTVTASSSSSSSTGKDFLKVLYSNRSAAYLKLNKVTEALRDSNKCIEIDSTWSKGYTRKGDALFSSKQYTEAYNAYNAGLRISPNDSTLTEKSEQAMRAIRNASNSNASSSYTSSSSSTPSSGRSNTLSASASLVIPELYVKYIQMSIFFLGLIYCIPFIPIKYNYLSYRVAVGLFISLNGLGLYGKYGRPQFNSEYYMRLISDIGIIDLLLGFILIVTRPYLFALGPIITKTAVFFSPQLIAYVRTNLPAAQAMIDSTIARFIPSMSNVNVVQALNRVTSSDLEMQLVRFSTFFEVYQGFLLVVELISPSRNIILIYIWWQYLRLRYMMDQVAAKDIRQIFIVIDSRAQILLIHRYCPSVVRTAYGFLKTYIEKQVQLPSADNGSSGSSRGGDDSSASGSGSGGGIASMVSSMLSKCSIM